MGQNFCFQEDGVDTFPPIPLEITTKSPGRDICSKHKKTLKVGDKKADCLGTLGHEEEMIQW